MINESNQLNENKEEIEERQQRRQLTIRHHARKIFTVPAAYCADIMKHYFKYFFVYFSIVMAIVSICILVPKYTNSNETNESTNFPVENLILNKHSYIQQNNPIVYIKILKELQKMQYNDFDEKNNDYNLDLEVMQEWLQKLTKMSFDIDEDSITHTLTDLLYVCSTNKLPLRDYALEYIGGRIISTPQTIAKLALEQYSLFGIFTIKTYSNPRLIIQPDVYPGKCFAFEGEHGKIRIQLSSAVYVTAVTLEHAPMSLLGRKEIMSSPREFAVNGFENRNSEINYCLGKFTYMINGPPLQTFLITDPTEFKAFPFIELEILNNYGNPNSTCVYRFRVHGRDANSDK